MAAMGMARLLFETSKPPVDAKEESTGTFTFSGATPDY
jgi:hypothetical protein